MPDPTESLERPMVPTATLTDSNAVSVHNISEKPNTLLADVSALYLKTKNFHGRLAGLTSTIIICFSMITQIRSSQ